MTPSSSFPFGDQRKGRKEGAMTSSVFVFLLAPAAVLPLLELSDLLGTFCLRFGVQNHAFPDFWKEPLCIAGGDTVVFLSSGPSRLILNSQ